MMRLHMQTLGHVYYQVRTGTTGTNRGRWLIEADINPLQLQV